MDPSPSDAELVALARSGDKPAFGQLADRYMLMARGLALRLVARDGLADDVVQEALLQAYLSLRHLKDAERFRSWFYGIVLNVCRAELRTLGNDAPTFTDLAGGASPEAIPDDDESSPQVLAERREVTASVLRAVEALPPKDRRATLLFYFEALSVREVAEALGMTDGTVRVHLHSARAALRERLGSVRDEAGKPGREAKRRTARGRRNRMTPVTVADVIEAYALSHRVIALLDEVNRRILPIWVGEPEAAAIVRTLRNVSTARPMTAEFAANLLKAVGSDVEAVHIASLQGETFYATVKLRTGNATSEVDARPSDALALAVLTGAPIFADDAILAEHGVALSEEQVAVLGRGLDALGERLTAEILAMTQSPPVDDAERTYRELRTMLTRY